MEVTDVRIRLVHEQNSERLRAFATITLDHEFVVRDMKVIEGNNGMFVAMPSRKMMLRCRRCNNKNHARSNYCNECGRRLNPQRAVGNIPANKEHVDVAHPITQACRDRIHVAVIDAFNRERNREREATPRHRAETARDTEDTPASNGMQHTPEERNNGYRP